MDFGEAIKTLKEGKRVTRGLERQEHVTRLFAGQQGTPG